MARDWSRVHWFYEADDGRRGPVSSTELLALAGLGAVEDSTLVSFDSGATWQPYATVAEQLLAPAPPPPSPPPLPTGGLQPPLPPLPHPTTPELQSSPGPASAQRTCALCNRGFEESELLRFGDEFVCADCKPIFVQKLRAGQALPRVHVYAGFWVRVGAKLIDGLILYVFNLATAGLLALFFGDVLNSMDQNPNAKPADLVPFFSVTCGLILLQMAFAMGYTVFFLKRFSATPGKIALKLKVIRSDGSPLSTGRAFGRHFGDMLSSIVLGIGYILVAFDEEKRALHDHLCDTRVIRTQ